jgi:tetratricopeptide (TPR) repeat protein
MLVAATVNIHHFVLDGAIWKLKGRIAEVLIRSGSDTREPGETKRRFGWRHLVWAACALALVLYASRLVDEERYRRGFASRDIADARAASERLTRLGLDRGSVRFALGQALLKEGRPAEAREQLLRSLELAPRPEAQLALGRSYERERLWVRAAEAYEAALAAGLSEQGEAEALALAAGAWLAAKQPERARPLLERVPADDPRYQHLFEEARGEPGSSPPSF